MMTWARGFQTRQYLKGSLWVLPLVGCLTGVVLSELDLIVDTHVQLPSGWQYSPTTASSVLAAIIGAMIGLLGFVVTVSVLVVQQATGSLSPRYMRLWYRDRLQKVVLAVFAGTFTFAFGLLRRIETNFVPDIGVTVAGVAVGVSLVLLLVYVNRFTHSLRPVAVAAMVTRWGQRVLAGMPAVIAADDETSPIDRRFVPSEAPILRVTAPQAGAIQAISEAGLIRVAEDHDCTLVLSRSVGDFVPSDGQVLEVYGSRAPDPGVLRGLIAFGVERTIEQDPAFALRILVDIAIRALSAAVNDPTTAVQVLDYIEELVRSIGKLDLRSRYALTDKHGRVRLVVPGRPWEVFLQLAFTEIVDYGAAAPQVCRRLRAILDALAHEVPRERLPAVQSQTRRLDEAVARSPLSASERAFASDGDPQGIGGERSERRSPLT